LKRKPRVTAVDLPVLSTKTPRYYFWKSHSKEELLTPLDVSQSIAEVSSESVEARQTLKSLEKDIDAHFAYLASLPDHWPVNGRMTSPFGNRKSPFGGGSIEFHDGIDLAADYGEPVSAAADGVVVYTGYRGGYGRTVIISHSLSGYKTSYCHLSKSLVKHGERVSKGQKIALAGSTGRSTGPHLHFIVEKDGVLLDPLEYSELGNDAWLIKVSFFLAPLARGVISLVSPGDEWLAV